VDDANAVHNAFTSAATAAVNTAPVLSLVGGDKEDGMMEVRQGSHYHLCSPGTQVSDAFECELGATASDEQDGNLDESILV
jgi:hypothetical protein